MTSEAVVSDFAQPCELCPRSCGVQRARGERGRCGAGDQMEIARIALHFWEEPPLSGQDGSGTVFFSHCGLGCVYCQNYDISHQGIGKTFTIQDLAAAMMDLQRQGALNINLVTATHYAPLVRRAVVTAREQGLTLPIVWNTSGYETVATLRSLEDVVDVYLTDLKYITPSLAQSLSGASDYPHRALEALDEMVHQTPSLVFDEYHGQERLVRGVIVRHLVLPHQEEEAFRVIDTVQNRYGSRARLSLMNQFTPLQKNLALLPEYLRSPLAPEAYEAVLDYADAQGVQDYYWQSEPASDESFIPDFRLYAEAP